jgi:hypothetical protein
MFIVGELDGKLIMKYEGGGLSVYDYVTKTPQLLLNRCQTAGNQPGDFLRAG